jgi:hypothetical protein
LYANVHWRKYGRGKQRAVSGDSDSDGRQQPEAPAVAFTLGAKIRHQLPHRGWTYADLLHVLQQPHRTVPTRDTRHLPGGTQVDEPATAYVRSDGHYVVRNDLTGDIVQVSNRNDAAWKAAF